MRRLLLFGLVVAALGVASGPAHAADGCRASAGPRLDLAGAAAVPAVVGNKATVLGAAGAKKLAAELTAGGNLCGAAASVRVEAAARAIERAAARGDHATAKRLLRALLASLRHRTTAFHRATASAAAGCPVDAKAKIKVKDSGAADSLRAAAAAQKAGDASGAAQAMAGARSAYGKWAGRAGSTSGDFVSMAKGAQQLGMNELSGDLLDKARKAADADVDKAKDVDRCTASAKDMGCQLRASAVSQLLGGDGAALEDLSATSQAIQDRLEGKLPDGCEEWSFQMKWTTQFGDGTWVMQWGGGRFRVSRKSGTIDGSQAAGYGPGWGGIIGNASGDCIEETDEGTINHGPGTLTGGPFRYSIGGSVSDTGMTVEVASEDAHVSVSVPPDLGCQILGGLADYFINQIVKGPFPIEFELAPDARSAQFSFSDENGTMEASIQRIK